MEYRLPIGQDDQKLRIGFVGLGLNKHLTNPKPNIPSPVWSVILEISRYFYALLNKSVWVLNRAGKFHYPEVSKWKLANIIEQKHIKSSSALSCIPFPTLRIEYIAVALDLTIVKDLLIHMVHLHQRVINIEIYPLCQPIYPTNQKSNYSTKKVRDTNIRPEIYGIQHLDWQVLLDLPNKLRSMSDRKVTILQPRESFG